MDKSLLNLSLILIGLKSGQTYASASKGLEPTFKEQKDSRLFKLVIDSISKGTLQATDGISYLLEYFRVSQVLERHKQQKLSAFKIQVKTGIALAVTLSLISFSPLAPDSMRPTLVTLICSTGLIATGLAACKYLESKINNFFGFFSFLFCLKRIEIGLRSGRTFQTSLADLAHDPLPRLGDSHLQQRANLIWSKIIQARDRGFEISPLIANIFEIEIRCAQDAFDSKAQQMATFFLVPLYLCFLPAAMLPILAPIARSLSIHLF